MKIGIIGCGWLGSRLAKYLGELHNVYVTTQTEEKKLVFQKLGYSVTVVSFLSSLQNLKTWDQDFDVILVTIPLSKRVFREEQLQLVFNNLKGFIGDFSKQLIFTSSIGVYPNENKIFKEEDLNPSDSFVEHMFIKTYPQTNILRLGGLMGYDRLLRKYNITNRVGAVNHVHPKDICNVIKLLIDKQIYSSVYNVVATKHPTKQEVIDSQNGVDSVGIEVEGKSQRIISSEKLIKDFGFQFIYPDPKAFHL